MFAAPLLFLLLLDKQWARAATYAFGYAAIGVFWLWWPNWMWSLVQAGGAAKPAGVDYLTRLINVRHDDFGLLDMYANLLRFVAWQHLLLIPLLALGIGVARKDRLAGALAGGVILTICVMAVILPIQGHGFGYRYLHGLIGNCILLAVFGWKSLGSQQEKWRGLLLRATAASIAIVLPIQAWMAHALYAPAAEASARINASKADYAIIGATDMLYSRDLVYNSPQLDRRPVRLLRDLVDLDLARKICADHAMVALAGDATLEPIAAYFGFFHSTRADAANRAMTPMLIKSGCRVAVVQ
jgi:hypothetical protein